LNPVFVAIDTPDLNRSGELAASLKDHVGGVKLGLEFFCANGPDGVRAIASTGMPVFLDLKLHDIPNTVAGAMRSLESLRPSVITIHAAGGRAMMEAAKEAAPAGTRVVAVTVLTSLDGGDLQSIGVSGSPAAQVERLANLARQAGLDGIVCSGAEVKTARAAWPEGFFVVPGIRPQGAATADQKRVATPSEAIADGASLLVIGRPITDAPDPAAAALEIARSLGL
jgi:orotidine-5'-phosphate decarboxylase